MLGSSKFPARSCIHAWGNKMGSIQIGRNSVFQSGLIGASILGLGRAVGETMAVTMLIGNATGAAAFPQSLFQPGQTMASIMANEFAEASQTGFHIAALIGIGLILFLIALGINVVAHLLVARVLKSHEGAVQT